MQCYLNEKCVGNISFTFHNVSFASLLYSLNSLYHVVLICNLGKHGGPVHSTAVVFVGHVRTVTDPERGFCASQPTAAAAEANSSNLLLQKKPHQLVHVLKYFEKASVTKSLVCLILPN